MISTLLQGYGPRFTSFLFNLPSASLVLYPKTRHTRPARVLTSISVRTHPILVRICDLIRSSSHLILSLTTNAISSSTPTAVLFDDFLAACDVSLTLNAVPSTVFGTSFSSITATVLSNEFSAYCDASLALDAVPSTVFEMILSLTPNSVQSNAFSSDLHAEFLYWRSLLRTR